MKVKERHRINSRYGTMDYYGPIGHKSYFGFLKSNLPNNNNINNTCIMAVPRLSAMLMN
ncbi:hypothetical protein Hanom_Chr10g00922561 [Helianthus anomalus]